MHLFIHEFVVAAVIIIIIFVVVPKKKKNTKPKMKLTAMLCRLIEHVLIGKKYGERFQSTDNKEKKRARTHTYSIFLFLKRHEIKILFKKKSKHIDIKLKSNRNVSLLSKAVAAPYGFSLGGRGGANLKITKQHKINTERVIYG